MKDAAFQAYVDRIEHEFFRRKARPGTLSPDDFRRVRRWFDEGVPLDAAIEAVTSAFNTREDGRDGGIEEVNSLRYCEPFVERALKRRRPSS